MAHEELGLSKTDEIEILNSTIQTLDSEIHELLVKQAKCRRRINELQAVTTIFPVETLSTIFESACELNLGDIPTHDYLPPEVLGAVCSHWRQVAWSTPTLWTHLELRPVRERFVTKSSLELLQLYFNNVRGLSLSLRLHVPILQGLDLTDPKLIPQEELFKLIFQDNSSKLQAFLCNKVPPSWWQSIRDNSTSHLPNLTRLNIGLPYIAPPFDHMPFLGPSLTHVSFVGPQLPLHLPWHQLASLKVTGISSDIALKSLLLCPRLEEFDFTKSFEPAPELSELPPLLQLQEVVLSKLTSFGWYFSDNTPSTHFILTRLRLPSLRHLRCWGHLGTHAGRNTNLKHEFFARLPGLLSLNCQVTTSNRITNPINSLADSTSAAAATAGGGGGGHGDRQAGDNPWLILPKGLQKLTLRALDIPRAKHVFSHFTLSDEPGEDNSSNPLPQLRILELQKFSWMSLVSHPELFSLFLGMVRSRREGPAWKWESRARLMHVRLQDPQLLIGDNILEGSEVQLAEVERLVREGLRVEVGPMMD